jgi:hypothetical protein
LGVDAVLTGHAHIYERLDYDSIPYFVNGLGGLWKDLTPIHQFGPPLERSRVRYNVDYGAQLVTVDDDCINFTSFNRSGDLIDSYTVKQ